MCGILAVIGKAPCRERFEKARELLTHRGPDYQATESLELGNCTALLGHTRLSIFDTSSRGNQPMYDAETGSFIIYNGEVFNWPELKSELQGLGHSFVSNTDTEVILKAFHEWGEDCVKRFNGFWAFLIVAPKRANPEERVFLSRDRSGIKPLYYCEGRDFLVVSSEIKPIYRYLRTDITLDKETFCNYLVYGRSHYSKKTIYRDIFELEPAHNAWLDTSRFKVSSNRYWNPSTETIARTDEEALEEFSFLLEDATRIRLRSDRELAITLSGGLDSTAIAIAARKAHAGKLKAFTSHFPYSKEIDEAELACETSAKLGLEHELVEVSPEDIKANYEQLAKYQELFVLGFSQLVNWFVLSKVKESGIIVFLNGQGGDELFLGYTRFIPSYILSDLNPISIGKRVVETSRLTSRSVSRTFAETVYFANRSIRKHVTKRHASQTYARDFVEAATLSQAETPRNFREVQTRELFDGQLCRLLRFDDRTASAFGLEGRPVFLDHRLIEFALSLESKHLIRNGRTKYLIRRYIAKEGLENLAWSKRKLGFPAPKEQWYRQVQEPGEPQRMKANLPFLKANGSGIAHVHNKHLFKTHNVYTTFMEMRKACGADVRFN